ncbi:MAG: hypothetical protein K2H04_07010 [Bacteroidaceae bacterium]|nr:hypothetical protein [Bacteroidaceae bacterium]
MVEPCKWTLVKNNIGDKGEKLDFTRGLQLKAEVSAPTQEQWNQLYSRAASIQMIMLLFDAKGNLVHSCEEGTIARDEEIHTLSTEFLMNNNLLTPSSKYTACVAFLISGDGTTQWQELWTSKMENPIIPVWFSEKFTFTTPSQKEYDKAKAYEQEQEH